MSTTSTFQGMDTEAKPSSRVLAPPGGGSSNIFGGNDEAPVQRKSAAPKPQSDILNQGPPAPAPAQSAKPNPKIAYNPITGQPYDTPKATASNEEKPEEKEEEKKQPAAGDTDQKSEGTNSDNFRSTRVSQPPGGRSTALW